MEREFTNPFFALDLLTARATTERLAGVQVRMCLRKLT